MKNIFMYITLLLTMLLTSTSFAQTIEGDVFPRIDFNKNYVINSEFEKSVTQGAISTMGSVARTSATALSGSFSVSMTATASGQVYSVSSTVLSVGLWGKDCESSFDFRYVASNTVPYEARVLSGTTLLATESLTPAAGSGTARTRLFYSCPNTATLRTEIRAFGSAWSALVADKFYTGVKLGQSSTGDSVNNYIENFGFESSVTNGYLASGSTVTSQLYANPSYANKKYAQVVTTAIGQYFETSAITLPTFAGGNDLEVDGEYLATTGDYRMELFVSGTVVASQTVASSTTWTSLPMMVAGAAANQTTAKLRFTNVSSGTATLLLDNLYLGSKKSFTNGAIVGPFTSAGTITVGAVTTPPTKGTISSDQVSYSRIGPQAQITYNFRQTAAGSAGSGDYLYSLPSGLSFDLTKVTAYTGAAGSGLTPPAIHTSLVPINSGAYTDNINGAFAYISVYSATQFRVLTLLSSSSGSFHSSVNVPYSNANLAYKFGFTAYIDGWQGTGVSHDSRCPNDISCNDEYVATVAAYSGSVSVVTNQNPTWTSNGAESSGQITFTFANGVFPTVKPHCDFTALGNSTTFNVTALSNSSITVRPTIPATGAVSNTDFTMSCIRQGADVTFKKTIQGYLSQTVTTSGQTLEHTVRARFGGAATETTVCSSTPCTIYRQSGGISSITRSATGQYQIVFPSGTFSAPPSCFFTVGNGTDVLTVIETVATPPTSTTFNFNPNTTATTVVKDVYGSVVCIGPR